MCLFLLSLVLTLQPVYLIQIANPINFHGFMRDSNCDYDYDAMLGLDFIIMGKVVVSCVSANYRSGWKRQGLSHIWYLTRNKLYHHPSPGMIVTTRNGITRS